MLSAFLVILLNTLMIGSMLAFITFCVLAALAADNVPERLIRFGALASGGLVVLGAQAAGVSFSQLISTALDNSQALTTAAGVVIPGAAGVGLSQIFLRAATNRNIFAIRVIIFIGMLAAVQFAEIYASVVDTKGFKLGAAILPNIAFVVGILLCIALTYDPKNPEKSRSLREIFRQPSVDGPAPSAGGAGRQPG
ncbi:MAG TPA: hypothetical protein VMV07_20515 [Streptosporangiaceae bacterium]|nr:hypothetical protein [Streptosporangiaceae bacterium]